MRTSNPVLGSRRFQMHSTTYGTEGAMTINGTITKCLILLVCALVAGAAGWRLFMTGAVPLQTVLLVGGLGGTGLAILTAFKPQWAPVTAPLYALLEGCLLGGISGLLNSFIPGIAAQAICLTFGTLLVLLVAYRSGLIRVTPNFQRGLIAATGAVALVYLVSFVMGLFGLSVPYIHEGGTIGIVFSLVVVTIAALNLVLDFNFIEQNAAAGAPKYLEWYGAFGLMVTVVWLYLEILNLLAKLASRR